MDSRLQYAILNTLSYFQVFEYPLTKEEILKYLPVKCNIVTLEASLGVLASINVIYRIDNYYCLKNDLKLVYRRKQGNKIGRQKLKKANLVARFLGLFPFVEAVCISGSLSKDFALKDSDLDYFIITAPNRMWMARNFMHLFRKLTFAVNAQKMFCMNYFISIQELMINPQNEFTAIELASLKPAFVHTGWNELITINSPWVSHYLPNAGKEKSTYPKTKKAFLTRVVEYMINKIGGDKIEDWFYKSTMKRWAKKWALQGYDVEKCMLSAGQHFNTPVNYPKNLPEIILYKQDQIFEEAKIKLLSASYGFLSTICYN